VVRAVVEGGVGVRPEVDEELFFFFFFDGVTL
jgi:hypothetical protein